MPTSELSNALNPHIAHGRSRTINNTSTLYAEPMQSVIQRPQQYHRSELELAIAEPESQAPPQATPPPSPPQNNAVVRPRIPNQGFFQELLRVLNSAKECQELERKRQRAWEEEQEAKYTAKQAEMERKMLEMRQEIASLRSIIGDQGSISAATSSTATSSPAPMVEQQSTPIISPRPRPVSTSSQITSTSLPFTQAPFSGSQNLWTDEQTSDIVISEPPRSQSPTFSPPSRFIVVDPSSSRSRSKKRPTPVSDDDDSDSSCDSPPRPLKRKSHHDTRCLTIQHAMRSHILRVMQIDTDKELPDGHPENTSLGSQEPVRFVWEKTPKQSVHNGRMKARILKDLKDNRALYKHVPDKEFNKKSLDSVFDQAFVTLRQKFKAQRDATVALMQKQREDQKSMRARRISRKKSKLTNRSEARIKLQAFEHITFDGAFQMECMSSEESDVEEDGSGNRSTYIHVRGLAWRSMRLQRFFSILDEEESFDKTLKPKRGTGRKERYAGEVKDECLLPPQGIATWMISRRWLNRMHISQGGILTIVEEIVDNPPGFDWNQFHALGEESDDDTQHCMVGHAPAEGMDEMQLYNPHPELNTPIINSSSLHNALAPIQ